MEKPGKHGATPKKRRSKDVTVSEDRRSHTSSPRSKIKNPQASSAERRYKEMLHTTSHIYQTQDTSGMTDTLEGPRVSSRQIPKDTIPVREKRSFSTGSILPEGITTHIPLTEIMSRERSASAVINSEISEKRDLEEKAKNPNPAEKGAESSVQQIPVENSVNHEDQNEFSAVKESCRKHSSAYNDGKQKALISRPKLCESCTVSMLSYIAMLRDMLDEVTTEITNPEEHPIQCADCIKERVMQRNQIRASVVGASADAVSSKQDAQRPRDLPLVKQTAEYPSSEHGAPVDEAIQSYGDQSLQQIEKSVKQQRTQTFPVDTPDSTQTDSRTAVSYKKIPMSSQHAPENQTVFGHPEQQTLSEQQTEFVNGETRTTLLDVFSEDSRGSTGGGAQFDKTDSTSLLDVFGGEGRPQRSVGGVAQVHTSQPPTRQLFESESRVMDHSETPTYVSKQHDDLSGDTFKGSDDAQDQRTLWQRYDGDDHVPGVPGSSVSEDFHSQTSPFLQDGTGSDGILSVLSKEEREIYDSARGGAGWERLADTQEYRDTSFGSKEEAFVTMATTNAEAISCLVLGSSLLLCRTTRTLCVIITDGVSPSLRAPLASVFQVVQSVRSLDTVGTTKVALLDQPDLGIFFRKLHVWRLAQFSKCVFLNPDTLVIQNCDELFCHEELSAVPDIGWPDCFNSGVFVFQPSVETFWKLVEFAESEGSYDGGDQGLLNAFFKTWSKDIHKKLSFIYNLMANVSYTYTPAFRQFGRNVKIVQFQGPFKPWHVKFYASTGQIAPSTAVHPTYVQFVHVWLNIFRVRGLPLFSQDIQSFASSQNIISASELLKFYPSPIETEADFLLTPPSVRLRPDPLGTPKQPSIIRRHSIGSYKELKQETSESEAPREHLTHEEPPLPRNKGEESITPTVDNTKNKDEEKTITGESRPTVDEEGPPQSADEQLIQAPEEPETTKGDAPAESIEDDGSRRSSIPGSEIGDYHGMAAWEQGRMDYMGSACSENIIKRLHFLMDSEKSE